MSAGTFTVALVSGLALVTWYWARAVARTIERQWAEAGLP